MSAIVVLAGVFASVLGGTGAAAASPAGCSIVVAGENVADNAVQSAVNIAHPGQTICLAAGVYPEQVTIKTPDIRILGAVNGHSVIDPSAGVVNTYDFDSAPAAHSPLASLYPLIAVVLVDNVSSVVLKDLTIDAAGAASSIGGCTPGIVGLDFQNVSSGELIGSTVTGAELAPSLLGCQSQSDLYAYTGYYDTGYTPTRATVQILSSTFTAYGKGGIVCDDPGLVCAMTGDKVVGLGPTTQIAANGIQVAFGAGGAMLRDTVSGNDYTGATATNDFYGNGYSSSGILLYLAAAGTSIERSVLTGNQIGILGYADVSDLFSFNRIVNSYAYGIAEYGSPTTTATIAHNVISDPATQSIGILVANGTFYLTGNKVAWTTNSGDQGASQAITGPGTVYPTSPPASIATAAIQAISDGDPTDVFLSGNTAPHSVLALSTLSVFGGTVVITG